MNVLWSDLTCRELMTLWHLLSSPLPNPREEVARAGQGSLDLSARLFWAVAWHCLESRLCVTWSLVASVRVWFTEAVSVLGGLCGERNPWLTWKGHTVSSEHSDPRQGPELAAVGGAGKEQSRMQVWNQASPVCPDPWNLGPRKLRALLVCITVHL